MGLLDKVKETAQKGTEMAKGAVSAGQDKFEEVKVQRKISDLKEELGGVVYAQRSGTPPPDADASIERIVAEIAAAEVELAEGQNAETDGADPVPETDPST